MGKIGSAIYRFFDRLIDKLDKFDENYQALKLKRAERKLANRKRKAEIKKLDREYNPFHERISKLATHKVIMYFIFINCTVIEIYSMRVMIMFADLSALPTLMVAVITESISYAVYCAKSYSGTKQEKIQELDEKKFELEKSIAMFEMENGTINGDIENDDNSTGGIEDSVG
jgi:hypothetical protein